MICQTGLCIDINSFRELGNQDLGQASGKYLNFTRVRESDRKDHKLYYVLSVGTEKQDLRELSFKIHAFIDGFGGHINDLPFVEQRADKTRWTVCKYQAKEAFIKDVGAAWHVFQKFNAKITKACAKHTSLLHLFDQLPLSLPTNSRIFTADKKLSASESREYYANPARRQEFVPPDHLKQGSIGSGPRFQELVVLRRSTSSAWEEMFALSKSSFIKNHEVEGEAFFIESQDANGNKTLESRYKERKISFWSLEQRGNALFHIIHSLICIVILAVGALAGILPCVEAGSLKDRIQAILFLPVGILLGIAGIVKRTLGVVVHPGIAMSYQG